MPSAPPNAYAPGANLTVGSHNVSIIKYISSGGFAHVYTCNIDPPFRGSPVACLKRVQVPSKWQLNLLRQEVDAMKRLRGNPTIVSYIDSHASRLNNQGHSTIDAPGSSQQYEVFLLMEYCSNNGLIDFMNTRLTNKLTEPEILVIMRDITLAVAMCHHLQPPLIHRDIKIENVLLDEKGTYKLCDFGSAVPYAPVPKTSQELQLLKDDIMQHTTPQYRAPEMIELTRGFPIDDKSDIWALGCFLYKLCYYTTPFESQSHASLQDLENSIVNSSHTLHIPHNRPGSTFSPRLRNIIKCCLREDPRRRPNAVQLLDEVCVMMNIPAPKVVPASVIERPSTPAAPMQPSNGSVHSKSSSDLNSINRPPPFEGRKPQTAKTDPFASIDKSKLLQTTRQHPQQRPKSLYAAPRPTSIYGGRDISPIGTSANTHQSSNTLKNYIQRQLSKSNESIITPPDEDDNTLNFLRDMEDISSQNTGGSFKASFKNGLRKISTGNSSSGVRSSNNTGNNYISNHRRSSISSIKQILTGGGSRKASNHEESEFKRDTEQTITSSSFTSSAPKKLSIQRRMVQYLNNNNDQTVKRTAHGYGRYTAEESDTDDLEAINDGSYKSRISLNPPQVPTSLSSQRAKSATPPHPSSSPAAVLAKPKYKHSSTNTSEKALPSITPSKMRNSLKKPPPKPTKPVYLRTAEGDSSSRRLSSSSEISIPDLDDLEKQFAKRFPSYV
ncbi:actin-regulating kinase prk1 [Yamadazyma tenuis]|uniref:non-specific serine/threonine protein kinase n=1 Tax=Candida tenuis (strain ATCC 10573 / BCRC 21748 / CBS 615 / JCM 9827 / NBRC 10315 / NRRL Y-1498 / VKM Y-70) TaxID=590646 RepID=G3AXW6_CANTC|nr:kinase-like protein [Yamadazyma tenuis ATCC 10573]EGV65710.1 kinase-like protein [Yamadazyma tenuis ATCC 10573]WEJ95973.1 actin-regulating kinase prk1 [Yamadazyma tenuis]